MDMGKYKYDLQKKANQAKKKQKTPDYIISTHPITKTLSSKRWY